MPKLIPKPTRVEGGGNKPIVIDEYVGRINTGHSEVSVAYLSCPGNWVEPAQTPGFDEITVVLKGILRVQSGEDKFDVKAGQAIFTARGERVQYSTPTAQGAEYIAVCLPAFSLEGAHREEG